MSLFQGDNNAVKDCIVFFNGLDRQQKAIIVTNLNNLRSDQQLLSKLGALLNAIQNDIAK